MKRIIPALAIVAIALTGCSSGDNGTESVERNTVPAISNPDTAVFDHALPDGRTVTCIWAKGYKSGGLSCDWDGAK